VKAEVVLNVLEDVREQFQREEDQSILKRDLHEAAMAIGGKDACDRIRRALEARVGLPLTLRVDAVRRK
jgi:hypothetical protein